ncbi:MAG: DUF1761 domain-containing protein [Terracidiphilus sp.]|jgi:uncharacterized membrane protein YeaQ/YmgE (transglycosylase-associated protein family)
MHHLHFNFLAVLAAALYQWILGALWYSLLFAKPWMAATGRTKGERPKGAVLAIFLSFIGALILSFMLAHVVRWAGARTMFRGAFVSIICWAGFILVPLFFEMIFEKRPCRLFAINIGYWLVAVVGSGCLLAVWR